MTVDQLRAALESAPGHLVVGAPDQDGEICQIQFAGVISDDFLGMPYFLVRPNGGFPVFGDEIPYPPR